MGNTNDPILTSALLFHYPSDDFPTLRRKILQDVSGPHWYFRRIKTALHERFSQLMDHSTIPKAFLFGSPHIDNYAKTNTGCGMIDFDRALVGPYAWDLQCFLLSMSLRQKNAQFCLPEYRVTERFFEGYQTGLTLGKKAYTQYEPLAKLAAKKSQSTVDLYLASKKKWAKKLITHPVPSNDPLFLELMRQYLHNLEITENFDKYQLIKAGRCSGSLGRAHNLLVLQQHDQSLLFIDIKPALSYLDPRWPHHQYYSSSFDHDGKRMIAASKIHAPGVTAGESVATLNGVQYWGRAIPLLNKKIKGNLSTASLALLAYAVGTQLGRGHGLTQDPTEIEKHLIQHKNQLLQSAIQLLTELKKGWIYYVDLAKRMKK